MEILKEYSRNPFLFAKFDVVNIILIKLHFKKIILFLSLGMKGFSTFQLIADKL